MSCFFSREYCYTKHPSPRHILHAETDSVEFRYRDWGASDCDQMRAFPQTGRSTTRTSSAGYIIRGWEPDAGWEGKGVSGRQPKPRAATRSQEPYPFNWRSSVRGNDHANCLRKRLRGGMVRRCSKEGGGAMATKVRRARSTRLEATLSYPPDWRFRRAISQKPTQDSIRRPSVHGWYSNRRGIADRLSRPRS